MRGAAALAAGLALLALAPGPAGAGSPELGFVLGWHDFDARTGYGDHPAFGLSLSRPLRGRLAGVLEFHEVYTRRQPSGELARQVNFAIRARLEPMAGRVSPSLLAGGALVHYDGSRSADAFGLAGELGAGLLYRGPGPWSLRATWLLRQQRMDLHRRLEGGGFAPQVDRARLWERQFRLSLGRELAAPGPGTDRPALEGGFAVSWFGADPRMRFEPSALAAAYGGIHARPWLFLGMSLGRGTPRDKLTGRREGVLFSSVGGSIQPWPSRRLSPLLSGAATFMSFTGGEPEDVVSEGFDIGAGLRWETGLGWILRPQLLWRVQGFSEEDESGARATGYLGSTVFQLGVGRAF